MFVDEIKINLKAGRGGDGVVRWLHLKGKEFSGPAGGNGGDGGDVYAKAVRDIGALKRYINKDQMSAENGESGRNKSQYGKGGEDLVLELPVGSVITNLSTKERYELLEEGEKVKLLSGGRGGLGNEHFKASTNVNPQESTPGKPGEKANFTIELELVVDAGFVGFPNAGKSTLLNELTGASSKVGHYEFTTLNPNLGNLYGYILADIPGLIEGASKGKGLGQKFLRHIKRTKMIIHCISMENENPEEAYSTIRGELDNYDSALSEKSEIIVLTKSDLVDDKKIKETRKELEKYGRDILSVSILDDPSIKNLSDTLVQFMEKEAATD